MVGTSCSTPGSHFCVKVPPLLGKLIASVRFEMGI